MSVGQSTTPSVDRASEKRFIAEGLRRVEALERRKPGHDFVGEFITLQRSITDLAQNGTSTDGTISTGEVLFDAAAQQTTNIGGFAVSSPPVALDGAALSFDPDDSGVSPPCVFVSLDRPGWFFVQRTWTVSEELGIPSCWFSLSGDPNSLGLGGDHVAWIKGKFNSIAVERRHMLYLDDSETFPYLVNSPIAHECDTHDGVFVISVAYLAAP